MLKQIMKRAHELARKFEGDYQARLALALRIAWKEQKEGKEMIIEASRKTIKESYIKINGEVLTKDFDVVDYCWLLFSRDKLISEPEPWSAKWEIREEDLNKLKNHFNKKLEEYDKAFKKAKTTGEKAHYYSYNEDCRTKNIQCDIDLINMYVMPDGSLEKELIHTY